MDVLKTKLQNTNFNIVEKILSDFGLEKGSGYCDIHKQTYGCIIDKKTKKRTGCPICEEEAEKNRLQQEKMRHCTDGLLKKYLEADFHDYKTTNLAQQQVLQKIYGFSKCPANTWLLLVGNNGTGKTYLAHAILKQTGGVYREFDDISSELLDAQARSEGEVGEIINKYSNCKMLVIDEIDKVKNTEGRVRWLNVILRKRYNNLLPLVILGNTNVDALCKNIDIPGNNAIRDRINEVGLTLEFNWESYRDKIQKTNNFLGIQKYGNERKN